MLFTVSNSGVLEGGVSSGDISRWLVQQDKINLNIPISYIQNTSIKSLSIDSSAAIINKCFSEIIDVIPLLDSNKRVVAVALQSSKKFNIGRFEIGANNPTFIIAEVGNNHNGDYEIAKSLLTKL